MREYASLESKPLFALDVDLASGVAVIARGVALIADGGGFGSDREFVRLLGIDKLSPRLRDERLSLRPLGIERLSPRPLDMCKLPSSC